MKIEVAGLDSGLRNMGIARFELDLDTMNMRLKSLHLTVTKGTADKKVVRKNSDDLARARVLRQAMIDHTKGCRVLFGEVPSGAQSARAATSFGIVTGLLACSPVPLIEVQQSETKMAAVGTKTASKEEMIEWAVATYPDGPWLRKKHKGVMRLIDANEHIADACAVAHAGIKTEQFRQLVSLLQCLPVLSTNSV